MLSSEVVPHGVCPAGLTPQNAVSAGAGERGELWQHSTGELEWRDSGLVCPPAADSISYW